MSKRRNYKDVYCVDCGRYLWHAHGNTKRCPDCKKAFNLIRESEYYRKNLEKIKKYQKEYQKEYIQEKKAA